MSERLEAVDLYLKAKGELERAKRQYEIACDMLRPMGTFNEGGAYVDVSVISRETLSSGDIKKLRPDLYQELKNLGFVKTSESERLTVRIKELHNAQ